jgi:hypothetical protein
VIEQADGSRGGDAAAAAAAAAAAVAVLKLRTGWSGCVVPLLDWTLWNGQGSIASCCGS